MRLRLIVCASNLSLRPPSSPSPSVFLVHFPPHLISTLRWFPLCSFECIIGFWWPHFFSFILVCLCSVTHIFVSPLMSMWITDEKLSVDKLVTTQNGRRHLTFWMICVGTGQLMNTWGSEQTGSARMQGSAVDAVRGAVPGEGGGLYVAQHVQLYWVLTPTLLASAGSRWKCWLWFWSQKSRSPLREQLSMCSK